MNDYFGAHMSISGGLHLAPERGKEAGCSVIQIFTQNSNQWKGKIPSDSDASLFKEKIEESGLLDVVSHDIYLINLASAPGEVKDKSMVAFKEEMERCNRLGINKIVMHPGSHLGEGEDTGLKRIVDSFNALIETTPDYKGKILLENTAGQGTNLGFRFEHLKTIIDNSSFPDRFGICLDTCHAFAAGYNLVTAEGYKKTFEQFDRLIDLDRLLCFHMNDSKKGLSSKVDRHEHIGQGEMGLEPFRMLVNDSRFTKIPKILETPKGDNNEMDAINLKTLRDMVKSKG
ncbi:MAG: deoxyribonuclease IV [Desulfuromonadales bacterium]|nr:deoxyribonuclease IV [Desulfuromonadales bacterium]